MKRLWYVEELEKRWSLSCKELELKSSKPEKSHPGLFAQPYASSLLEPLLPMLILSALAEPNALSKKALAAALSRFLRSKKSTVWPSLSAVR